MGTVCCGTRPAASGLSYSACSYAFCLSALYSWAIIVVGGFCVSG